MFAQAYRRLPLGGKLSRKRLMRGINLDLRKAYTLPTHPTHKSCAKPHSLPPRISQSAQKLPCAATAVPKNERNFADRNGGCRAGKFGVGQGGLEGRETPPKGVSLRLQGLPFPYISKFSANFAFCSMNWRRGSTLSPIRSENISSQAIASSIVTRRIVR